MEKANINTSISIGVTNQMTTDDIKKATEGLEGY